MSKRRSDLPKRVYEKGGAYWHVRAKGKSGSGRGCPRFAMACLLCIEPWLIWSRQTRPGTAWPH